MEERAILLVADSQTNADMFHAIRFLFGDPVIYVRHSRGELLVCSNFERAEAAAHSHVPVVRAFDEYGYPDLLRVLPTRSQAFAALVLRVLQDLGSTAATVTDHFPLSVADYLRANGVDLLCDPDVLLEERAHKQPADSAAMQTVQRANERAMRVAIDLIAAAVPSAGILMLDGDPLTSERVRAAVERSFLDAACQADVTIIAGGAQAASPHHPGAGPLRPGTAVVLDFFPRHAQLRFYADMTRTVSKGDPGQEVKRMYDVTLRAQEAALEMIAPGVNGREVYEKVCGIYEEAGYATSLRTGRYPAEGFIHSLGHGLGLQVHEQPGLNNRDQMLEAGHVVTVEPGLYYPALGGVRIEDVVIVTDHGCDVLTHFEKKLIV